MRRIGFFILASIVSTALHAQSYPSKPVRLVIGFAPGGAADFVARAFQEPLGRALGQPIVVENRPGAGSSIAAEHVAKSAPDGYTLLIASPSSILVNPVITPKAGFQPLKDLVAVSKVSSSPLILAINPGVGVASVKELIAHARKNPGKLNYATSGNGSAPHMAAVLFVRLAQVDMVHVPFKGGAPAVQSVLAGDTQLAFATPPSVLPLVQAGRLKALAITSRNATPLIAGVPGMAEAGLPDYEIGFWYGVFVPAGTPPQIVRQVFEATSQVVKAPETARILAREGTETASSASPEDFARFLEEDAKLWTRLVRESGAKAD
jgi:tripartite-type tricarboxylate transporter receptor subunit TctC